VGSTTWGQWGRKQVERVLWISPITPNELPPGDSRTWSPVQVLDVLLDSVATWFAGKTNTLSVMGKWTCYFLHKTTSSAWRKVGSCPATKFKTDGLLFPKLFYHLQVPSY